MPRARSIPQSTDSFHSAVEAAVLSRNGKHLRDGEVRFRCPHPERHEHGDAHPSARYNSRKFAWTCDVCGAGGSGRQLAPLIGVTVPRRRVSQSRSNIEARHVHVGAGGAPVFRATKVREADGSKRFYLQHPHPGNGRWTNGLGGAVLVPYGLDRLTKLPSGSVVVVPEGERDANTAWKLSLNATTNPMSAEKWRPTYSQANRTRN